MSSENPALSVVPDKKITRDDIESKLRELQGEVDEGIDTSKSIGMTVAVGVVVAVVVFAYWAGRRRGRKRQTVLEIRRI
jgi:hypothetical protein